MCSCVSVPWCSFIFCNISVTTTCEQAAVWWVGHRADKVFTKASGAVCLCVLHLSSTVLGTVAEHSAGPIYCHILIASVSVFKLTFTRCLWCVSLCTKGINSSDHLNLNLCGSDFEYPHFLDKVAESQRFTYLPLVIWLRKTELRFELSHSILQPALYNAVLQWLSGPQRW